MTCSHFPRKRFGQHFLNDAHIIQQIVEAIDPAPEDHLVEIGPGLGALTQVILPRVHSIEAIELDRDVIPLLQEKCASLGELKIYQGDALKFDFAALKKDKRLLRIIGNLPYNISTPIIFHLLSQVSAIQDMHFMFQKEVVDRLIAKPNTKDYGRLSVMVQYFCDIEFLLSIHPHSFTPPPRVESALVRLKPYKTLPYTAENIDAFAQMVRAAFSQRRKMIHNSLRGLITPKALIELGIDGNIRAEQLSVADFVRMSNWVGKDDDMLYFKKGREN